MSTARQKKGIFAYQPAKAGQAFHRARAGSGAGMPACAIDVMSLLSVRSAVSIPLQNDSRPAGTAGLRSRLCDRMPVV
jgi:hypothetical protein